MRSIKLLQMNSTKYKTLIIIFDQFTHSGPVSDIQPKRLFHIKNKLKVKK